MTTLKHQSSSSLTPRKGNNVYSIIESKQIGARLTVATDCILCIKWINKNYLRPLLHPRHLQCQRHQRCHRSHNNNSRNTLLLFPPPSTAAVNHPPPAASSSTSPKEQQQPTSQAQPKEQQTITSTTRKYKPKRSKPKQGRRKPKNTPKPKPFITYSPPYAEFLSLIQSKNLLHCPALYLDSDIVSFQNKHGFTSEQLQSKFTDIKKEFLKSLASEDSIQRRSDVFMPLADSHAVRIPTTANSIQTALIHNQKVQCEIRQRIGQIASLKVENRNKATLIMTSLYNSWNTYNGDDSGKKEKKEGQVSKVVSQKLRQFEKERLNTQRLQLQQRLQKREDTIEKEEKNSTDQNTTEQVQPNNPLQQKEEASPKKDATKKQILSSEITQQAKINTSVPSTIQISAKWSTNPKRKWNKRFFIDPSGFIPDENKDTRKRRQLNGNVRDVLLSIHSYRNWSKKEIQVLNDCVEIVRDEQLQEKKQEANENKDENDDSSVIIRDGDVNYEKVALLLQQKADKNAAHRTARACRLYYTTSASPSINKSKFKREEILTLLQLVRNYNNKRSSSLSSSPPWDEIAYKLNTNRTPWQCFHLYQSKFHPSLINTTPSTTTTTNATKMAPSSTWTPQEDELLLKYTASLGPQFVLSFKAAINHFVTKFFPTKNANQVLFRLNGTLVNPNYRNEAWTKDEEKKLVLCMKVYKDAGSAIVKAVNHFPGRSSKYVSVKWNRSLNPKYTFKKFTPAEDKALLRAVQTAASSNIRDWMSIAKQFPNREPRVLQNRWVYLTSDDTSKDKCLLKKKFTDDFKANFAARRGVIGKMADVTSDNEEEKKENVVGDDGRFSNRRKGSRGRGYRRVGSSALLSPDDLTLRVKKRRKTCEHEET